MTVSTIVFGMNDCKYRVVFGMNDYKYGVVFRRNDCKYGVVFGMNDCKYGVVFGMNDCKYRVVLQRPELLTVTLAWHACQYKVHKFHQSYILLADYLMI